jgi:hypothetical protein
MDQMLEAYEIIVEVTGNPHDQIPPDRALYSVPNFFNTNTNLSRSSLNLWPRLTGNCKERAQPFLKSSRQYFLCFTWKIIYWQII